MKENASRQQGVQVNACERVQKAIVLRHCVVLSRSLPLKNKKFVNRIIPILIIILSMQFIQCRKSIKMDFSNTEWISDSLDLKDQTQWREFVYFDSIGSFIRTTWWNENYVLDEGSLAEYTIKAKKGDYKIEIIDSFNIKITKADYVGIFHGNPWKKDEDFDRNLNRFIFGDSIKKKLIGTWNYSRNEIELGDYLKLYDELPEFAEKKFKRVCQRSIGDDLKIQFTNKNKLIAENEEEGKIEFRYSVNEKEMDLSRSDYILSIDYELLNLENLVITKEYQSMGKSKIYFKKE